MRTFICGLFKDVVTSSDFIPSDGRITGANKLVVSRLYIPFRHNTRTYRAYKSINDS
jgi:hypothetical protein